ncbi:MAG: histidine--tRNA ligase, partial [bacterium]
SVGDPVCRPKYIEALRAYFTKHLDALCPDCRRRLDKNPLRVLDCKREGCHAVARGAPSIIGYLDPACRAHFEGVQAQFDALGTRYVLDPFIVRGLDYYTRTAVEVFSRRLGAQNAMFGGGRYDGLAEQLGGRPTPGVGLGFGLDRLLLVLEKEDLAVPEIHRGLDAYVITLGEAAAREGIGLVDELRRSGIRTDHDLLGRGVNAQMRQADRLGARTALILGDAELAAGEVTVRTLATGEERRVPRGAVLSAVRESTT